MDDEVGGDRNPLAEDEPGDNGESMLLDWGTKDGDCGCSRLDAHGKCDCLGIGMSQLCRKNVRLEAFVMADGEGFAPK